eukprot:1159708-Pelagomonas_calceolata.AAC.11
MHACTHPAMSNCTHAHCTHSATHDTCMALTQQCATHAYAWYSLNKVQHMHTGQSAPFCPIHELCMKSLGCTCCC